MVNGCFRPARNGVVEKDQRLERTRKNNGKSEKLSDSGKDKKNDKEWRGR
jgi:hypothetical protein